MVIFTVMVGAYRGLVMLQETYSLDIMEMADGRVSYKGKVFQVRVNNFAVDIRLSKSVVLNLF